MPLNTQIIRDGESLKLRWSDFHVAAMVCASSWDSGKGPFTDNSEPPMAHSLKENNKTPDEDSPLAHYITMKNAFDFAMYHVLAMTPLNEGSYTLKHNYVFCDCTDGEILHLQPGDVLKAHRS